MCFHREQGVEGVVLISHKNNPINFVILLSSMLLKGAIFTYKSQKFVFTGAVWGHCLK